MLVIHAIITSKNGTNFQVFSQKLCFEKRKSLGTKRPKLGTAIYLFKEKGTQKEAEKTE